MNDTQPRHPDIMLKLTPNQLNPVGLIGRTRMALRRGGVDLEECAEFVALAEEVNDNGQDLLPLVEQWVTVIVEDN